MSWLLSSLLLASGRTKHARNKLITKYFSRARSKSVYRMLPVVYPPVVVSLSSCTCGLHYGGFNRNLHFHHRQSSHLTHYTRPWLGRGRVHREGDGWSPVWPQRQGYSRALTSVLTVVTVYTAHLLSPPSCGLIQPIVSNAVHLYTAFSCSSLLTSSEFLLVHEVKWSEVFQLMPNQHQAKLCSN